MIQASRNKTSDFHYFFIYLLNWQLHITQTGKMADTVIDKEGNYKKKGLNHAVVSTSSKLPASDREKRKLSSDPSDSEEDDIDGVAMLEEAFPKRQKVSVGFSKTFGSVTSIGNSDKKNPAPITIKLGAQKNKEVKPTLKKASASVASAFNQESDEEEEMPPEARMRMRNIGRDTPTSAGPNSFGKTRQGFCDVKKVFERQLKEKMEEVGDK
ncbi:PEST proteolytic signal-containing nuclear protein [Parasteatoda tepidariorum]|uniref:PEST proteolytic signal-containing nuclear protein n=1 Tax=Parasteatoda tepidariorum TaxID=114398 RepID=UPI00077F9D3E|nr:PEST proteolytic signal-containing nuclear protein [Parasteatoda tepidariorum]